MLRKVQKDFFFLKEKGENSKRTFYFLRINPKLINIKNHDKTMKG